MALAACAALAVRAQAEPGGAEVVWLAPRDGAEIDITSFRVQPLELTAPYRLSAAKWLTTTLRPGELAWIRIEDDFDAGNVRLARLAIDANAAVLTELHAVRKGSHDVLVAAPLGPPMQLALQARSANALPQVQIWIAAARSPGYRWELWEDEAKRWAQAPVGLPPAPPDELARDLVDQLAVVADALERAGRQDKTDRRAATAALLTAEALLGAAPSREPVFPYSRRIELTQEIADAAQLQRFEQDGQQLAQLPAGHSVRFSVSGPGMLRIDAHALLGADDDRQKAFDLVLRSGGRVVAYAGDALSPGAEPSEPAAPRIASLTRLVAAAPTSAREYVLEARGADARIQIFLHRRVVQVEDAITGSEDIAGLLERAASEGEPGLLHELLAAEAAFADRRANAARSGFAHVYAEAHDVALQAFALGRMAAITQDAGTALLRLHSALALLDRQPGESIARLRDVLALDGVVRALADGDLAAARDLSHRVPSLPARFPTWAGTLLRGQAGARAEALSLLGSAVRAHPLDRRLLRAAAREWWIGSRWASLPLEAGPSALASDVVMQSRSNVSCARASQDGSAAFVALPAGDVELRVPETQAAAPYLRRFHVLALRSDGSHALGRVELTLDGESSSLPALPGLERIAVALDQGSHHLRGHYDRGQVLVPCTLLGEASIRTLPQTLYVEHQLVTLSSAGASVSALLPEPGRPAYIAIDAYQQYERQRANVLLGKMFSLIGANSSIGRSRGSRHGLLRSL